MKRIYLLIIAIFMPVIGTSASYDSFVYANRSNVDDADSGNMILIEGGTFTMGDTFGDNHSDEDAHEVTLTYDYYLGAYEVTFNEYDAYCKAVGADKPDDSGWGREDRPVIYVSWYDAVDYCNWLSEQDGLAPAYNNDYELIDAEGKLTYDMMQVEGYRLPTEAEWEYAAREGGKKVRFGNGKNIADPEEINFCPSSSYSYMVRGVYQAKTVAVGSYEPNALGLYDMSGNVWEWCGDWYNSDYYKDGQENPYCSDDGGEGRVLRGGGWYNYANLVRASIRDGSDPLSIFSRRGFRLARTAP